jgi:hypothetical protein
VLCLVSEKPQHGFATATQLGSDGDLGRIWRVPKPVVCRALQRLEHAGLLQSTEPCLGLDGFKDSGVAEIVSLSGPREPPRVGREVASAGLTGLADQAGDVGLHGLGRYEERRRDGRVREPLSEQQEHVHLPASHA